MNNNCLIDFEKFHTALRNVNLLNCQGSIVRVSGLKIESTGPSRTGDGLSPEAAASGG